MVGVATIVEVRLIVPGTKVLVIVLVTDGVGTERQEQAVET